MVAGWIEQQGRSLCLADLVGGIDRHRVLAGLGLERKTPRPEGVAAKILAERRRRPGLAAVGRGRDAGDAVAGVPRQAAYGVVAGLHLGAVAVAGDQRVDDDLGN